MSNLFSEVVSESVIVLLFIFLIKKALKYNYYYVRVEKCFYFKKQSLYSIQFEITCCYITQAGLLGGGTVKFAFNGGLRFLKVARYSETTWNGDFFHTVFN